MYTRSFYDDRHALWSHRNSKERNTVAPGSPRHSLAHTLDQELEADLTYPSLARELHTDCFEPAHEYRQPQAYDVAEVTPLPDTIGPLGKRGKKERRKVRACSVIGCPNYTIDRGLCFRHGGGRRCSVDGCSTSAKYQGLCWKHGGSICCSVSGCTRGTKSKRLCWSHGGASKCMADGCEGKMVSKGLCWAHGGGKRCLFDGCKRSATKKTLDFCVQHGAEVSQIDYVFEL